MIYLASPYSHPDSDVQRSRFHQVCVVAAEMMGRGEQVFSPIAHTHPIAECGDLPTGWAYWEAFDRWYIERCDEVVVLMLDGWKDSLGVKAEIKLAIELNTAVRYITGKERHT